MCLRSVKKAPAREGPDLAMTSRSRVRQLSVNGLRGCSGSLCLLPGTETWFKSHSRDMKLDSCCPSSWLIEEGV